MYVPIFQLQEQPNKLFITGVEDLNLPEMIEYAKEMEGGQEERALQFLYDMERYGAATLDDGPLKSFSMSKEAKKQYFEEPFLTMKRIASEMTLDRFTNHYLSVTALEQTLNRELQMYVEHNDTVMTLDYFIRMCLEEDKVYYISHVVLGHI